MGSRTRWLAAATVCVTVAATLTASGGFLLTIPLILGVIADPHSPRRGRWLMWVGAAYLSLTLLQMEVGTLPEFISEARSDHLPRGFGSAAFPLSIASILLIVWCDVTLMIDVIRTRRSPTEPEGRPLGPADWMVWTAALLFSVYSFLGIPFVIHGFRHGFADRNILLTGLALILVAIAFDIALITDALRTLRPKQRGPAA
jgi:hypothetical protein